MSVWRGADDVPHSGILPPYEAGWWPDPASFCGRVSCQVADITSHVKHTTTTTETHGKSSRAGSFIFVTGSERPDLVPTHPGSPGQRAVKRLLLLCPALQTHAKDGTQNSDRSLLT